MTLTIPDSLPDELGRKLDRLCSLIHSLESVLIAFSGGVDSTFLARVAQKELGDQAVAVTARSETYPESEYEEAVALAGEIGIRHLSLETEELAIDAFRHNPPERCYYCKQELFGKLVSMARELGLRHVLDGANLDDTGDFRPGSRAAAEFGVRSPLKEARLTKEEIRRLSHALGLRTWDKPSCACLASRFPYGEPITADKVAQVARAEEFFRNDLGLRQVRVRHHGPTARIEAPPDKIADLTAPAARAKIVARLKELGFTYVTLDLQGYRPGSMNEVIAELGVTNDGFTGIS